MQAIERPDCDLFCRVIDNFGDAGVCWRLARCLARDHGWRVRLWIDAPQALACLKPEGVAHPGIEVVRWTDAFPSCLPAFCVIEAFACHLPPPFVAAMADIDPAPSWVNLEYLSAEDWIEDCHRRVSRDPLTGLDKLFFFPGFTSRTGGLLRERDLLARRDQWVADAVLRQSTLTRIGLQVQPDALQISLFSYESPAIGTLIAALAGRERLSQLWVPEGRALDAVSATLGRALVPGEHWRCGALQIGALAFMDQDDYDALLWHCDLNIVRGEDSFVRAQWAARPMIWHIYPQEDDAHRVKLDAFLDRQLDRLAEGPAGRIRAAHHVWNGQVEIGQEDWSGLLDDLPALTAHARNWAAALAAQDDLAGQLVLFNQTPI